MTDWQENGHTAAEFGLHARGTPEGKPVVEVDIAYYARLLDDPELGEADRSAMLEALWDMMVVFVELGFGVHPVQEVCGQFAQAASESALAGKDLLQSDDSGRRIE